MVMASVWQVVLCTHTCILQSELCYIDVQHSGCRHALLVLTLSVSVTQHCICAELGCTRCSPLLVPHECVERANSCALCWDATVLGKISSLAGADISDMTSSNNNNNNAVSLKQPAPSQSVLACKHEH
eukprot:3187-Heterococcus_DN1.PRE.3